MPDPLGMISLYQLMGALGYRLAGDLGSGTDTGMGDLGFTSRQAERHWSFPHVLGPGQGGRRGAESPSWPGMLVDWA